MNVRKHVLDNKTIWRCSKMFHIEAEVSKPRPWGPAWNPVFCWELQWQDGWKTCWTPGVKTCIKVNEVNMCMGPPRGYLVNCPASKYLNFKNVIQTGSAAFPLLVQGYMWPVTGEIHKVGLRMLYGCKNPYYTQYTLFSVKHQHFHFFFLELSKFNHS